MPEFVALADLLRAPRLDGASARSAQDAGTAPSPEIVVAQRRTSGSNGEGGARTHAVHESGDGVVADDDACFDALADALAAAREARLFRARLGDAFDAALARMLRELAADVLARELRLAPCDVAELARRALERAPIVRLRLAPADAERGLHGQAAGDFGMPVVADPSLRPGDAVFELAGGSLDARLGVRLAVVLDALGADAGPLSEAGR